jgi:outer membrane protein TolC
MHKIGKICMAVFILFSASQSVFSEEKLVLTLDDSIELALSQNPNHLATGQRVEAARSMVREAAAGFFPSLNAQGLTTLDEKVFTLEFPSFIPGQPPQRVEVDFTRDYQFALSLSVPIFTGGRLVSGFKQAKYNLQASQESLRQSQHDTVYNTKRSFYGYLLAEEFVVVAEEAVEVAEKHFQNVKSLYEVGMASKFDLLRSEVELANLKPQLIRARNSLKIAGLSFKTLLGLDLSQPVEVKGELVFTPFDLDLETSLDRAIKNRPELSQLRYQKGMAHEMLSMSRADFLPTVAISGAFNYWADLLNFSQDN